jgi:hypothetical protein
MEECRQGVVVDPDPVVNGWKEKKGVLLSRLGMSARRNPREYVFSGPT